MKLRSKLTFALLLTSLVSAAMVGGIAYWLLMRDFSQGVQETAFAHFRNDITAYLRLYGSLEAGERYEPFPQFVRRQHRPSNFDQPPPPREDLTVDRHGRPPFRFLLLDPNGRVIKGGEDYAAGESVPPSVVQMARPIEIDGRVAVLAVPLGSPNLSPEDRAYLRAMRHALLLGFLGTGTLAVLLGLLFGRRLSAALDELTGAIHAMRRDRTLQQQVPVRSNDEIGALASAFNEMSAELTAAHNELRELSICDPLTGLYNRRYFNEQAALLYQQALRYGRPLTVMVGDLDLFKQINDRYSHAVGDEVLRRVGALLRQHNRKSDILARHGGEEFVIAFPETPLAHAGAHCEQLRRLIESAPWHEVHPELRVTMSMGLSDDMRAGSIEKMLHQADGQLYAAKDAGRNCIQPVLVPAFA